MEALPTLIAGFDAVVTIGDERCADAVRALAAAGLDVGETGAATVGAVAELRATHHDAWPLPDDASVLVLATEGVTDPAGFERIVGRPPQR
jgi:diaminopropionate ammonia-lyase